jgi:DNA primase
MPAQDWSRVRKASNRKHSIEATAIPIGTIVSYYGGEVREGKSAAVRCCIHTDSRRSAVMNTYDNLYFCHTCGKGGSSVDVVMHIENLEFKDALNRAVEIIDGSGQTLQPKHNRRGSKLSRRTWDI